MKYSDLIKQVATTAGYSKSVVKEVIDTAMTVVKTSVKTDGEVTLNGVGRFLKKVRPARTGVNPATKEKVSIPETKTVAFKVSKEFKDLINE